MTTPNQTPSTGERLAAIEATQREHTQRFNSLDARLNTLDARLTSTETRLDARLTSIETRLTLILISTLAGFAGLIAAVFFQ